MVRAGQRLKEERLQKGLSLEDVVRATKIRHSFLSAIEKGDYQKLPSSAYTQGFIVNYAEYLGLPKREILALFRREFLQEKDLRVLPEGWPRTNEFSLRRIRFQQTIFLVLTIFVLLIGYILFQYRYAVINPPLEVTAPLQGQIVGTDVIVSGNTDPNAVVSINEDIVAVDKNGEFTKKFSLFPGPGTIVIRAINRFGNNTTIERRVEVKSE